MCGPQALIAWTWGNFMVLSYDELRVFFLCIHLPFHLKHCTIIPKEGPGWLVTVNLPQKAEHNKKAIYSMGSSNL